VWVGLEWLNGLACCGVLFPLFQLGCLIQGPDQPHTPTRSSHTHYLLSYLLVYLLTWLGLSPSTPFIPSTAHVVKELYNNFTLIPVTPPPPGAPQPPPPPKPSQVGGPCGVSLSAGQSQLVCVARCLLSGAPLVLLDEATAAVDPKTAALLNQVGEGGGPLGPWLWGSGGVCLGGG